MRTKKIRVGILFGGRSAEHEISLQSAKNVVAAIDKQKYDVVLIGIDRQGNWLLNQNSQFLLQAENPSLLKLNRSGHKITIFPHKNNAQLISLSEKRTIGTVDVIFPILHGPYGEDGTVQGLLKLANLPYVGSDVLGSALGMDKDVQKRLLRDAKIPTAKFIVITRNNYRTSNYHQIVKELGLPLFVKPANLGSSVGITKIKRISEFQQGVNEALQYDNKVLIEEYIEGREIECSVLGNENPIASLPGEVVPQHEFYSYEAKYIDEHGAILIIPAKLPKPLVQKTQQLAVSTFKTLCCEGMARVDFFLRGTKELLVNEINTIPGFTRISMYPKLWEASGIPYTKLIDLLIQFSIERFKRDNRLKTSFS